MYQRPVETLEWPSTFGTGIDVGIWDLLRLFGLALRSASGRLKSQRHAPKGGGRFGVACIGLTPRLLLFKSMSINLRFFAYFGLTQQFHMNVNTLYLSTLCSSLLSSLSFLLLFPHVFESGPLSDHSNVSPSSFFFIFFSFSTISCLFSSSALPLAVSQSLYLSSLALSISLM